MSIADSTTEQSSFFSRLQVRLSLLILLLLFPALLLVLIGTAEQNQLAVENADQQTLLLARLTAANFEQLVVGTERVLIALTQIPDVRSGNTETCNALFVQLRQEYESYTNFYMVDTRGDTICTGLPDAAPINVAQAEWFLRAQRVEGFSIGDYGLGLVTGRPVVTFSYPIYDESGERLYYVGAALDLQWMNAFIRSSDVGSTTRITILDRGGMTLYRYPEDEGVVGQPYSNAAVVERIIAERTGTFQGLGTDNLPRLYGFAPLDRNASAFVLVSVSQDQVFARSRAVLLRNLAAWIVVGGGGLLLGLSSASRILVRPIQRLVETTFQFAKGDLGTRIQIQRLGGTRELQELGTAFNTMAESLQEAQKGLEDKVRERTRELTLLTDASTALASSLDYEETLRTVTRLLVPELADWCAIDLTDSQNGLHRLVVAHIDPQKIALGEEINRRYPPDPDAPFSGLYHVIRTQQAVLYPVITDDMLTSAARDAEHLRLLQQVGFVSCMIVPLIAGERPLGALTLVSATSGHHYDDHDLRLAKEMARRIASTLDNAYLYRERNQQRQQLEVTLASIGDAVIATDVQGGVIFINRVAQRITGWTAAEAIGAPLNEVFRIISETTRQPIESPFEKVLREGKIVGLANHTLLIDRQGNQIPIDDSGAPIYDEKGLLSGVILVFRDITQRREDERRINLLLELTAAFSKSVTSHEIAETLIERGLAALNAQIGTVCLVSNDGMLEIINRHGLSEEGYQQYRRTPLTFSGPLNDAVREGHLIWISTLDEFVTGYPHFEEDVRAKGTCAIIAVPLKVNQTVIGGFAFSFTFEKQRTFSEEAFFNGLAYQCAEALERARLYEAERQARALAEDAQQRLRFLSEASALLATSLDIQTTFDQITRLIVPEWAEWTHLDLLAEDDITIRRMAVRHVDPTMEAGLYELNRLFPAQLTAPSGAGKVIRTGVSDFFPNIPAGVLEGYAQSPRHLELLRTFDVRSFIIVPLTARGKTFGAMTFGSQKPAFFTGEDLPLLEDFGRRAALSIANAQSYQVEQQSRAFADAALARVNRLQSATAALSEAVTPTQVSAVIVEHAVDAVGASSALLARWDQTTLSFEVMTAVGYTPTLSEIRDTDAGLLNTYLRQQRIHWIESAVPLLPGRLNSSGAERWGMLALRAQDRPFGVLVLTVSAAQHLEAAEQAFLHTLVNQCEQALERALLYEQAKDIAAVQERQRLARDLHDAVSQVLFSSTSIAEIVPRTWHRDPNAAFDQLAQVVILNRAAMAEMRSLLLELRPETILRTNLSLLVDQLLKAVKGRKTIETQFMLEGREEALPPEVHVAFYRIAQEAINNVVKHSQASQLAAALTFSPGEIRLVIRDNGMGFDMTHPASGLGLQSMRERAESLGIRLHIESQKQSGTQVQIDYRRETRS